MQYIDNFINNILRKISFLDFWILRIFLGIAFCIHGYQAFPLPSKGLMEWFNFSPILATLVPIVAITGGSAIIISGFVKNPLGNLLTRLSALIIVVYMCFAFFIAHKDWFITSMLFTSEQIFLFGIGLFFLLRGKTV
jgi:uncharacterized membrane protein YphA (DoxX/SURF4 family)|tara:strand:+ start:144 stop:554 length:411 start_codon:yes stop_codon:yes gene_type:complete